MHEEMHMTQMQFTNTGAREIVSFLDTTFGQHGTQRMFFKKATRTLRWFAQDRGLRWNPHMMHMRKVQYGDVHSMIIFTEHKQTGL